MAGGSLFSITTLLLLRPTHPRLLNREQLSCGAWHVLQDLSWGIRDPCNIVQCLVISHLHSPLLSRLPKYSKFIELTNYPNSPFFRWLPQAGKKAAALRTVRLLVHYFGLDLNISTNIGWNTIKPREISLFPEGEIYSHWW